MFFGICNQWDRHVLFTLGRFTRVINPGLYFYIPFFQGIKRLIDTRIITYTVPLQKGLTKDNIPVEVDAIVFYKVTSVKDSALNVDDYHYEHAVQNVYGRKIHHGIRTHNKHG